MMRYQNDIYIHSLTLVVNHLLTEESFEGENLPPASHSCSVQTGIAPTGSMPAIPREVAAPSSSMCTTQVSVQV